MLRVDQLTEVLWLLVEGVVHNSPQERLGDPRYPGVTLSPNEKEEQYYHNGGLLAVDPIPHRALELLNVELHPIDDEGIRCNRRIYKHPCLADKRLASQGGLGEAPRRIAVYVDEGHPEFVIVRDSEGVPIVVPERAYNGPQGVLADLLDRDFR